MITFAFLVLYHYKKTINKIYIMKKIFFSFACLTLLFACTEEQEQQTTTPNESNQSQVSESTANPNDGIFSLYLENTEAKAEEELCIPVKGKNFNRIISTQYTLRWDPNVLKFNRLTDFKLKALSAQNFNTTKADKGLLIKSWFDPAIQGITLTDGEDIYSICFETIGESNSQSYIYFSGDPTIIEMSDPSGEIDFKSEKSIITVR